MAYKYCPKIILLLVIFLICGCATTGHKSSEFEVQDLKNQILVLEKQIQEKNDLINDLKEALRNAKEKNYSKTTSTKKSSVKNKTTKRTTKQIQIALKNAGYNPGTIDGKMGNQTRSAIKSFQKDNGLKTNGKVTDRTWNILSKYLNRKEK